MTCNFMKNKSEVQMTMEFFEKFQNHMVSTVEIIQELW